MLGLFKNSACVLTDSPAIGMADGRLTWARAGFGGTLAMATSIRKGLVRVLRFWHILVPKLRFGGAFFVEWQWLGGAGDIRLVLG